MAEKHDGRDESEAERLDRLWADQLQELRVMQTGTQLIAGFLLTLPFQSGFDDLDRLQRWLYLTLVVVAGVTLLLVVTPVAVHRRLSGRHVKDRVVWTGHVALVAVLCCIVLLVVGITTFVFDVVVSRSAALIVGAAFLAAGLGLLLVLPRSLDRRS
jgi:Na+/melibiose symporter-like transporter